MPTESGAFHESRLYVPTEEVGEDSLWPFLGFSFGGGLCRAIVKRESVGTPGKLSYPFIGTIHNCIYKRNS